MNPQFHPTRGEIIAADTPPESLATSSANRPSELAAPLGSLSTGDLLGVRDARFRFVKTLHALSPPERYNLLRIETDAEIEALFRVALDEQWFEVAAELRNESRRRGHELLVKPSSPNQ